jgi:hypothetical protein
MGCSERLTDCGAAEESVFHGVTGVPAAGERSSRGKHAHDAVRLSHRQQVAVKSQLHKLATRMRPDVLRMARLGDWLRLHRRR